MEDQASFGYWIRRRRKALDLTQTDLAARVGCAVITIQKIEADARRPSRQVAERLAEALALPPEERAAFLLAARAELAVDRLADPLANVNQYPSERAATDSTAPVRTSTATFPLPSGTVTFLFTDIESSTQLWEHAPQAMQAALARHDILLRAIIEGAGGVVVRTAGDGVHAAFARATDALAAALEAQRVLASEDWGTIGALRVRMALHTGVSEERAGDYFGPTLNRVVRLLAAGHGGQVLLSHATQELVCDHLPPDVELRALGEHHLKDLTRPEHIFQLVAPGLLTSFPPLRSLDSHRHNLPAQASPLIGREREVALVAALLRRNPDEGRGPAVRLLTLIGPGGAGKTHLALQVAAEVVDAFADGVWFIPLAAVRDPSLLVATISQTLGLKEVGGQSLKQQLTRYLSAKQLLLVLDNFEQLLDAAPLVAELLACAPNLTLLVTSRAVLHLSGEQEFVVPPLSLPDRRHPPALEQLTQYEAVRLFIARAQAVKSEFSVTNQNAPAVAEICVRLDGLPLAIELAAARIKLFSPDALLARLEQRLPFLTGGARDLPLRQQTLRDTIAWSYQLLKADEQALFRCLGVFVGSWTLEAAEAVCGSWKLGVGSWGSAVSPLTPGSQLPTPILDGLTALFDQSLVRQIAGAADELRFTMLETISEYALERLAEHGELEALRRRHAEYFLALAERAEPKLHSTEQLEWLERLDVEADNLRAALEWSLGAEHQKPSSTQQRTTDIGQRMQVGLRLAGALWYYWLLRGAFDEWHRWAKRCEASIDYLLQDGSEQVASIADPPPDSLVAACVKALIGAAQLASRTEETSHVTRLTARSITLARQSADPALLASALALAGQTLLHTDNAIETYREGVALARALGERWLIAKALENLAWQHYRQGNPTEAITLAEEALALARALGDRWQVQRLLFFLGCFYAWGLSQFETARALQEENLALARATDNRLGMAYALVGLAEVAEIQGDNRAARAYHLERLAIEHALGNQEGVAHARWTLGIIAGNQGEYSLANELLTQSLAFYREHGEPTFAIQIVQMCAWTAFEQGDYIRATIDFDEVLALARSADDHVALGWVLRDKASVALAQGELTIAEALLQESQGIAEELPRETDAYQRLHAAVLEGLGQLAQRQGDPSAASRHLRESQELLRVLHPRPILADSLLYLGQALIAAGELDAAARRLTESLALFRRMGARQRVAWALEGLAAVARPRQPARAARLWGAAAALRAAIGAPMWPIDRPDYERRVAAVRAAMATDAFDAVWAMGQALTWEQAAEEALTGGDADSAGA